MSKRRTHANGGSSRGTPRNAVQGRRVTPSRTPEDTVRTLAAWVVDRTLETLAPSQVYLTSALARLDEPDHGLLRELSLGTLRWKRRLDYVISRASHRSFDRIEPALRTPLRLGAYQLLFLDRIPHHAAVHEAVDHARIVTHKGGASFTNAVLRRIARQPTLEAWRVEDKDPVRRMAIENSHPDFIVRRWIQQLGRSATERLLAANNRPKAMQLLAFRDRGGRELLAEQLIDEGVDVEPSMVSPLGLIVRHGNPLHSESYRQGRFYVQDEASQAAALVPGPRPGEHILDAAAAPGGKSFTLMAVEPTVRPVLADVSPGRTFTIRENLMRLGRELPLLVGDASRTPLAGSFDRVVVDLPCTGTGTFRKNPELKWRISEPEIGRLSRQALRLLSGLADRVRAGGHLVAITCSLEPEENERVIERLLKRRKDMMRVDLENELRYPMDRWIVGEGAWQIAPDDDHDGFTVHVLQRRAG
ncbi:MAG: 16S rRNA (cytosine(967)-C(5))-methyltransferase RsmB [Thermoanaerobaculia bacterium]|nr:16S rRNA (cytosine(967)-C(5))-methyltransferase RsmB [Thermoanaerobaculia bacterium]